MTCQPDDPLPVRTKDYSHTYWKNSWRRYPDDASPDLLCFESGHYGLSFNTADLTVAQFKFMQDDGLSYTDVMAFENRGRMEEGMDDLDLVVEVVVGGRSFRAKNAKFKNEAIGLCNGRLWEAGRIAQHYELLGIIIEHTSEEDGEKTRLDCTASLYIVAWPEEFAISFSLQAQGNQPWEDYPTSITLSLGDWTTQQSFDSVWVSNELTLTCNVIDSDSPTETLQDTLTLTVTNKAAPSQSFAVNYTPHYSCFVVDIQNPIRHFPGGYTDIRDADMFTVELDNQRDEDVYVPVMFYLRPPANPTGLVPMLWVLDDDAEDGEYVPSGIPVQTSKNWHYKQIGNYLRAYTIIPAKPGSQTLEFRVYYGFYGPLCSASHANLSLVGYNNNETVGRWEQLAIGCFGETFCIDIEMCLTSQTVTDVRALMVKDEKAWGWTNAGWGGDWLCAWDNDGRKMLLGGMKVGYLSQGPCLTEVKYVGHYGSNAEVNLDATVHTMRTNDYARTIQRIRYDFNSTVTFTDKPNSPGCCFYRVGGPAGWEGWFCKKVALGNGDGLLEDIEIPSTLNVGDFFVSRRKIIHPGPWWIAFPESNFKSDQNGLGIAWKCLVIRSFKSEIAGVIRLAPKVTLYARQSHGDGDFYIDAMLTTNGDIFEFNPGDNISFDAEWITLPYDANSYYGDNIAFQEHLSENPKSWTTAFREAIGNNISANVEGGNVISNYPLVISVIDSVIKLEITGGVGAVPVRFEGLSEKKYKLTDDSAPEEPVQWHETLFCPENQTYSMTFNLLLDNRESSSWTLS